MQDGLWQPLHLTVSQPVVWQGISICSRALQLTALKECVCPVCLAPCMLGALAHLGMQLCAVFDIL